jgi:hypothetical protein
MVKGVANVWVPVEDIGQALDFYWDTLGFSVIKPWTVHGPESMPMGSTSGSTAETPRGRGAEVVPS